MEFGGPAEGPADVAAGQQFLVGLVAAQLPLLPPWRQRRHGGHGQRPPGPLGDRRVAATRPIRAGLDEVGVVGVIAHPVPYEPQAGERGFRRLPLLAAKPREGGVVVLRVVPEERCVDDRDPPDGFADYRERLRPVAGPAPAEPLGGVVHGGEGPPQRACPRVPRAARLIRPVLAAPLLLDPVYLVPVLAVPGHAAAGRAEARVLALRLELFAAALTAPSLRHQVMLRVTCVTA